MTVLSIFPLFFTIKNSFTDYYLLSKTRSSFIGVRNYVNIFKDAYFQKSLWNTVKFTVLAVIAETLFGLVLALFVNSLRKGQHLVRTLLLLPMLVPTVTAALIWQTMFSNNNGIINQMLEFVKMSPVNWLMDVKTAFNAILIIDIWQYTPLSFLLIYAELQTVPQSQYEAADIDGASYWNKLIHIILPDISTGIGMVVLLRTIGNNQPVYLSVRYKEFADRLFGRRFRYNDRSGAYFGKHISDKKIQNGHKSGRVNF